jgi:hypothetical protein
LLTGLIDYAGLFPPAKLSLDQAIRNYAAYRQCPERWMLGKFVIPPRDYRSWRPSTSCFKTTRRFAFPRGTWRQNADEFLQGLAGDSGVAAFTIGTPTMSG